MLYSNSERGRHLMTQPAIKMELKLVLEDVRVVTNLPAHRRKHDSFSIFGQPRGDRLNLHDDFRNEARFESSLPCLIRGEIKL
jgi:hypothetical protein